MDDSRCPSRTQLAGPDLFEWLALRRVSCGGVAKAEPGNRWFQEGFPLFGWLSGPLNDLVTAQRITLGPPDPCVCLLRRATLTAAGRTRLAELTGIAEGATRSGIAAFDVPGPRFSPLSVAPERRGECIT